MRTCSWKGDGAKCGAPASRVRPSMALCEEHAPPGAAPLEAAKKKEEDPKPGSLHKQEGALYYVLPSGYLTRVSCKHRSMGACGACFAKFAFELDEAREALRLLVSANQDGHEKGHQQARAVLARGAP